MSSKARRRELRESLHIEDFIGRLGDHRDGMRAPMFADAYAKCSCGNTLKTELDSILHLHGKTECLYRQERPASRAINVLDSL